MGGQRIGGKRSSFRRLFSRSCAMIPRISKLPLFLALFPASLLVGTATRAARADEPPVEKIEVTGSHIKRIDVEGVAPVVTVTRKEIERTGYDSVGDVIREQ